MIPPGIADDAGNKATETFAASSRETDRSLHASAVWTLTLQRQRANLFKQGKMISAPCLTIISLFRRKSVSGLANKTCTGTSKRYQLCKVQVRISFVLSGTLGVESHVWHFWVPWRGDTTCPVAVTLLPLQAAGSSLLWCPSPVSGL